MLVAKYHDSNCQDSTILIDIKKAIGGSIELRSKKDLIEDFISQINTSTDIQKDWLAYIQKKESRRTGTDYCRIKTQTGRNKDFH